MPRRSPAGPARPGWALAVLCTAEAMALLDVVVLVVALPSIQADLRFSLPGLQWVMTAYALPLGGLLILAGRLGDARGHRRVFAAGLAVFTAGSLAGGLAPTAEVLIAARVVQGVGAAALATSALALLTVVFPAGAARQRALGIFSAVAALGFTAGSVAGGAITQLLGWRWVLLVNVPLGLAALVLAPRLLPSARPREDGARLDVLGAVLGVAGLSALLHGVTEASARGAGDPAAWVPVLLGLAALGGFWAWERRAADPLLPPGFLAGRTAAVTSAVMVLKSSVGIAGATVPTLYLQQVRDASALLTGLAFVPGGVLGLLTGLRAAVVVRALGGPVRATGAGLLLLAGGLALMAVMPATGVPWAHLVGNALVGPGLVLTDITLAGLATEAAGDRVRGLAAAVFRTAGQLGSAAGLAVVTAVTAVVVARHPAPYGSEALRAGLGAGLACAVVLVLLAAVLATRLRAVGDR